MHRIVFGLLMALALAEIKTKTFRLLIRLSAV